MSEYLKDDYPMMMDNLDPKGLNQLRREGTLEAHVEMVAGQARHLLDQTLASLPEGPASRPMAMATVRAFMRESLPNQGWTFRA